MRYLDRGFWRMVGGFVFLVALGMGVVFGIGWFQDAQAERASAGYVE